MKLSASRFHHKSGVNARFQTDLKKGRLTSFHRFYKWKGAATGAFAGGTAEVIPEPPVVVVTEGGSSSGGAALWLALGGAVLVAVLVSQDDDTEATPTTTDEPK